MRTTTPNPKSPPPDSGLVRFLIHDPDIAHVSAYDKKDNLVWGSYEERFVDCFLRLRKERAAFPNAKIELTPLAERGLADAVLIATGAGLLAPLSQLLAATHLTTAIAAELGIHLG